MEASGLGGWHGVVWLNESKQYVVRDSTRLKQRLEEEECR